MVWRYKKKPSFRAEERFGLQPRVAAMKLAQLRRIAWQAEWQSAAFRADPLNWEQIYFSRRLSCYITFVLARTAVTPNQVTFLWVFLVLLGGVGLAISSPLLMVISPWLFWLAGILDHVDGELARVKNCFSAWGDFLDLFGHQLLPVLIFAGLTCRLMLDGGSPLYLIGGILATALASQADGLRKNVSLLFYIRRNGEAKSTPATSEPTTIRPTLKQFLAIPHSETGMVYLLILAAFFEMESEYVLFYGLTLPVVLVIKWRARSNEFQALLANPEKIAERMRPEWLNKDISPP
ncbi:MAG: CDP-alcohol phosphatidyltransferase family protein [Magnetococcales bacterium]|nr:CDP-alcohol phosphatidyltransferase family protein [Magnetococcales bacterium]